MPRTVAGRYWIRPHVNTISSHPVLRDDLLRHCEVERACAYPPMQLVLECVLDVRIPRSGAEGLRPEIADRIGATELKTDQVIDLVLARLARADAVARVDSSLHLYWDIAYALRISGHADVSRAHGERGSRSLHRVGDEREAQCGVALCDSGRGDHAGCEGRTDMAVLSRCRAFPCEKREYRDRTCCGGTPADH